MPDNNDPGEDVRLVISETSEWIRNADTKTGLLATVLAVLLGVISQKAQDADLFPPFRRCVDYVAFCFLVATVAAITVAYYFLYRALLPRVAVPARTRFAWPWVADASTSTLVGLSASSVREEAWVQARALALISKEKFRCFKNALSVSAFSGASFLIWLVAVSIH